MEQKPREATKLALHCVTVSSDVFLRYKISIFMKNEAAKQLSWLTENTFHPQVLQEKKYNKIIHTILHRVR